ncbi:MAG: DNA polymerase III subunit beta [Pseudobdellovibrionaceae bacterium]
MKFVIATSELQAVLAKLQNVVSQKAAIPILSNILVEACHDELVITATDLMVGVRCFCEAKIIEEGATTLPAKRFAQLVRELTTQTLEVSTGENEVTEVTAGSSKFKVHGMSRTEFPSLPDLEGAHQIHLSQEALKEVFFRTSFAVSREDNRYVLTGVFMHIANGQATFVGTDGKRLAKTRLNAQVDPKLKGEYIIPLKAVDEIHKCLEESGDATLYLMKDKIAVEANDAIIITKLLSGEYPDINRVIPTSQQTELSLHREELMTLLRQVSLFTSDTNQSVRFTFESGELKISANTMEVGEGKVSMPVNYQGDKIDIAFNPGFFLDILRHSREETISMGLTDAFNPGTITESASEGAAKPLFVIMPMRLNES